MSVLVDTQTAAWVSNPGPSACVEIRQDIPISKPESDEVVIKLAYSGVCHSDVYGIRGHTPMTTNIAGHEGVGRIVQVGSNVPKDVINRRVGIRWLQRYCDKCEICEVDVNYCPNQHNSGRDVPGTFQQYVVSPILPLITIPDNLDSMIAAPLLCAGLTIYSAIQKLNLQPGQWLLLPGAGGGLGHLGVQIGHRKGLKVIAIDTGAEKRELCMKLGAACFLDFKTENIETAVKDLTGGYGVHGSICMAISRTAYQQSISLLRNTGTLVCIGLGKDDLPVSSFEMLKRGLKIIGSSVGSKEELEELLEMAAKKEVVPRVNLREFGDLNEVLNMLEGSQIDGKVVVKLPE